MKHRPVTEDAATRYVRERVLTGLETLRDFERFAEALAAESRARTGRELPGNQGFAVEARPTNALAADRGGR